MPFFRRRASYFGRGYKRRSYTVGRFYGRRRAPMRRMVRRTARKVAAIQRAIEIKRIDLLFPAFDVTGLTGVNNPHNGIAQGTLDSERIGNRVAMKSFHLRGYFSRANPIDRIRLIIYIQRLPMGVAATPTDLIQSVSDPESLYTWNLHVGFKVLYDKYFTMNGARSDSTGIKIDLKIPTKYQLVVYNSTSGLITAVERYALYLFVTSQAVVPPFPQMRYRSRMVFIDP